MRGLKAVVIGLGVCVIAAFVVVVVMISQRIGGRPGESVAADNARPQIYKKKKKKN